ncbi:hypothetical protein IAP91_07690 [Leuconostoc mesenteroides]|nr:hypothetical protein [Leuconostoc mesenteroides]
MKTKVVSAMTDKGLENKLNSAIDDIEQHSYEIISITPWSATYRALILYK